MINFIFWTFSTIYYILDEHICLLNLLFLFNKVKSKILDFNNFFFFRIWNFSWLHPQIGLFFNWLLLNSYVFRWIDIKINLSSLHVSYRVKWWYWLFSIQHFTLFQEIWLTRGNYWIAFLKYFLKFLRYLPIQNFLYNFIFLFLHLVLWLFNLILL